MRSTFGCGGMGGASHGVSLCWIHSSTRTAHCPLQAAFYGVICAFLWRSASKYGAMQPGHCAVPVRRSLRCSPDVEFGSIRFTNRVQTHRRRLHQSLRERRPRLPPPGRRRLGRARPRRPRVACWRVFHVGAHGKQALHVCYEVFGTALSAAPDLVAWTEGTEFPPTS
jgi:hypothetical protein